MKQISLDRYRGEAHFALANIFTSCVSLITGVIAAIYIVPEELGVIQTVLLFFTYSSFLSLGVFSGLNRNLAFYKAKGDFCTMQDEINTSYVVAYIVAAVSGFLGLGVFLYYLIKGYNQVYLISCILLLSNLVLTPLITNIEATYKSGQEFGKLGSIKNIQSAIFLFVSFLPALLGAMGRIIAGSINLFVGFILRKRNPPYTRNGRGSIKAFKDLICTGFPILVSGYIWQLINVMDKTYIASALTVKDVGLFTISGYCITLFMMIPSSISALLYPKAAAIYGSTGKKDSLLGFWKKSIILMVMVLIPIVILAYFILPVIVSFAMPKYVDGIKTAQITLLTCGTFIYMGPSTLFGTFKKNKLYIFVQLALLVLFWIIVTYQRETFSTIESVAWLRFGVSAVQMLFVLAYTRYLLIK